MHFWRSGGLEILFGKVAKHEVELADRKSVPLKELLAYIRDHLIKERPELFVVDGTVYVLRIGQGPCMGPARDHQSIGIPSRCALGSVSWSCS